MRRLFLLIFFVVLPACEGRVSDPEVSRKLNEANKRIETLEQQVQEIRSAIDEFQRQESLNNFFKDIDKFAFLTPGDEGYAAIRFDLGILTMRLADIKPYANGSKITLEIGNTLSARIDGLKMKIEWGKVDDKGLAVNDIAKAKDIVLNEHLRPGAWTKTSIVLDGVPPSALGFVRLRDVHHSGISLMR